MSGYDPDGLIGYLEEISIESGAEVAVKVSCRPPSLVRAKAVRIIGPHVIDLADSPRSVFEGAPRELRPGSYCQVADFPDLDDLDLSMDLMPTRFGSGRAGLIGTLDELTGGGWALAITDRHLLVILGTHRLVADEPLTEGQWHRIRLQVSCRDRAVELRQVRLAATPAEVDFESTMVWRADLGGLAGGPLTMAAIRSGDVVGAHFDGRLGCLEIHSADRNVLDAKWDFSVGRETDVVHETCESLLSGRLYQQPTRSVPGSRWDGSALRPGENPRHYDAIHFHSDDLIDAEWPTSTLLRIPKEWPSGVYGVQLETDSCRDVVPFYVRDSSAKVCFLAPTATYTAYGNQRIEKGGFAVATTPPSRYPGNRWGSAHPEVGPSLYEPHSDGSGSTYASRRKPIADWRLGCEEWGFTADATLCDWISKEAPGFGVLTDEDLDRTGVGTLEECRVVITGTHPEYVTTRMLDALESWLSGGGRLIYLGGNGFYWRTAFSAQPGLIEVRRAEDGTRPWISDPGEYELSFDGQPGGLWRRLGRPPNRLTGVGFAAQGFGQGVGYRVRSEARNDPRTRWIFAGTSGAAEFGAPSESRVGAAGLEVDRFDLRLGSPRHAVVLASAYPLPDDMKRAKEEHFGTDLAPSDQGCRADVVFFETAAGGAVFSVGSIAWAQRLKDDPDLAAITSNVLKRFMDPAPFAWPMRRLGHA